MTVVICPKCKQTVAVPDGKDYAICCGEVIYVLNETHNSENEEPLSDSGGQ
jgi:hypothetical protein